MRGMKVTLLKINALQGGLLTGTIMRLGGSTAFFLSGVLDQLNMNWLALEKEITLDPFECGILMKTIVDMEEEEFRQTLDGVMQQLIDFKKKHEELEGVTKELLPNGQIRIRDRVGNCFVRDPMPWEISELS